MNKNLNRRHSGDELARVIENLKIWFTIGLRNTKRKYLNSIQR